MLLVNKFRIMLKKRKRELKKRKLFLLWKLKDNLKKKSKKKILAKVKQEPIRKVSYSLVNPINWSSYFAALKNNISKKKIILLRIIKKESLSKENESL